MVSPELLRRFFFFGGMRDDELAAIAMIAEEVAFPTDTNIFCEGDVATRIFVLASGKVELIYEVQQVGGLRTFQVGSIPKGELFGLSAFVEPYRMTATARADGAVKAIAINAAALRALSEVDCHLGYTLMRQIARALAERLTYARVQLTACN